MPLAEFTAIIMLWPVIATAAAGWLMRERVGPLRWGLVCGGFAGTLIVMRPGGELFGWAILVPLLAALASAAYNLITSRLAALDHPVTTQFYTGLIGAGLMLPVMVMGAAAAGDALRAATPLHFGLIVFIGFAGACGHLLLILAFGRAGPAALMPFTYTQIAFAALMGWLVFRQIPDLWAWIGIMVIAACGAATVWINMQQAERAGVPAAALEPAAD